MWLLKILMIYNWYLNEPTGAARSWLIMEQHVRTRCAALTRKTRVHQHIPDQANALNVYMEATLKLTFE